MSNRQYFLKDTVFETADNHDSAVAHSFSRTAQPAKVPVMKSRQFILLCGMLGMLGWLYLFGVGMLIDSKPFREALDRTIDWYVLFGAILTFTPTNVALLAMLAGFLGGCASLLMYSDYDPITLAKQNGKAPIDLERLAYLQENPISSALRGFIVYLTFLAGTVFGANGAFANTTQDQYCRLTGAVAVLAFGVGYDPTVFRQVLSLVTRRADSRSRSNLLNAEDRLPKVAATR
jgi:hypothetical protein